MKTFVRRASGAELSADLTEKETNERTNERRVYVSLFPSTATILLPCLRLRFSRKQKRERREKERERNRNFSRNMMRATSDARTSEANGIVPDELS